jgi:hypothetical protein
MRHGRRKIRTVNGFESCVLHPRRNIVVSVHATIGCRQHHIETE